MADDGTLSRVAVVQEPPAEPTGVAPVLRSHRIAVGLYVAHRRRVGAHPADRDRRRGRPHRGARARRRPAPDLLLLNDDDLTFAKIRLDTRSLATAVTSIGELGSSLARALVWGAAWDMTRDAEMSTGDFLTLVLSGLDAETDVGVPPSCCASCARRRGVRGARAPRGVPRGLGDACAARAQVAEPGSDRQLAFVRSAAAVARTAAQRDFVRGLLDGTDPLDGLAVDTDLRWSLLQRLVATGELGDDAIDDELARDDTATGRRQAAYARAAVPTAEAKAAAWSAAVEHDELPNALQMATVAGFVQADQRELLRAFVGRYFGAVARSWAERTNETAQTIVMGLYPTYLADQELVARTDEFLAGSARPAVGSAAAGRRGARRRVEGAALPGARRVGPTRSAEVRARGRPRRGSVRAGPGAGCGAAGRARRAAARRCGCLPRGRRWRTPRSW